MFEIMNAGLEVTVQDYPGRLGYWSIGISPAGPMDSISFRVANRIVGNDTKLAGLEITGLGPTIKFHDDEVIAFSGARFAATIDGNEVPWNKEVKVAAGSILKVGSLKGNGFRCYMAIRGGIDVPVYLGSRSTFAYGHFGGFEGRKLQKGDMLNVSRNETYIPLKNDLGITLNPKFEKDWEIGVIPGPHSNPDYFTDKFTNDFYQTTYKVSRNTNRLGIRLEGPKPEFARANGGEGGSHPSNNIDFTYAIGTINFSGDTPIIIGVDGPSLGGFVCYATVPTSEFWKVGQLKPGDTIRFKKMSYGDALNNQKDVEKLISLL